MVLWCVSVAREECMGGAGNTYCQIQWNNAGVNGVSVMALRSDWQWYGDV